MTSSAAQKVQRLWNIRWRRRIPFLIVGHPRCGTTSAAAICQQVGLDVGDEYLGADGISSWMMAVEDAHNPYAGNQPARSRRNLRWNSLILVVRDICEATPSVMIENRYAPASYAFRRKHLRLSAGIDLDASADDVSKSALSIVAWTQLILAQRPNLWFRIEDQQQKLRDFVSISDRRSISEGRSSLPDIKANARKAYDAVEHEKPVIHPDTWKNLEPGLREQISAYCATFGYADPTK